MKRRRLLQSIAAIPALPAIPAAAQYANSAPASEEMPKLRETSPEGAAQGVRRFFSADQSMALRRLADLVVPANGDRPGAVAAGAVEFLDFLIGQSEAVRQSLYKGGLDHLNAESRKRYAKPFGQTTDTEAKPLLAPLAQAWSYHPPKDPVARFLRDAKEDLLQATLNSKTYSEAVSRRSRSAAGMGAYWLPID